MLKCIMAIIRQRIVRFERTIVEQRIKILT